MYTEGASTNNARKFTKWLQACPKFTLTGGWKGYVGECSGVREEAFSVELMKSTENIWYENVFAFLPSAPRESTNATSGACGIAAVWQVPGGQLIKADH